MNQLTDIERRANGADDKAMLKAAANLTRDLNAPSARDLLGRPARARRRSAMPALAGAILLQPAWLALLSGAGRGARALPRGVVHPRADAYQEGRGARLPAGVEPDRRRAAAGPVASCTRASTTSITARPITGPIDDPEYLPLALMKPWTLPLFLIAARAGAGRPVHPLRRPRALVAAVAAAAADRGRPLFGAADQSASSVRPRPRASSRATGGGWRSPARLWAIALAGAGRDRDRAAARVPDLPRRRRRARCSSTRSAPWSRICGRMRASR